MTLEVLTIGRLGAFIPLTHLARCFQELRKAEQLTPVEMKRLFQLESRKDIKTSNQLTLL